MNKLDRARLGALISTYIPRPYSALYDSITYRGHPAATKEELPQRTKDDR